MMDNSEQTTMAETNLSDLLLQKATAHPEILSRMRELAEQVGWLVEDKCPLEDCEELEEWTKDDELMHFVVDTLRAWDELPSLKQKDYPVYMMLIALSPDGTIIPFLLDYLTFAYIRSYRIEELLLLSDILRLINHRKPLLNGVYNFVCGFFVNERRDIIGKRERRITDEQFSRAERNMPHLGRRSFKMDVEIKGHEVYDVKTLAQKCNIEPPTFHKRFRNAFGTTPRVWLDEQRMMDIKYLLQSSSLSLAEIAEKTGFATASSFSNFCVKHLGLTPGQWREVNG